MNKQLVLLSIFAASSIAANPNPQEAQKRFDELTKQYYPEFDPTNGELFNTCKRTKGADKSCQDLAEWHSFLLKKVRFVPKIEGGVVGMLWRLKKDAELTQQIADAAEQLKEANQNKQ